MKERIQKVLSEQGICSRRAAEQKIAAGKVKINGHPAKIGDKIDYKDVVSIDGERVYFERKTEKLCYALYKPRGFVTTLADELDRKCVSDLMAEVGVRLFPIGRLDKDSEGLLIMTDDGLLIHEMMSGGNNHEKEYKVKVDHNILNEDIIKLRKGIYIHELDLTTRPCDIEIISPKIIKIILTQGVNRQIRRMLHECGYRVESLCRTRIMNVKLAKMVPGEQRVVIGSELEELYRECGLQG